MKTTPKHAATPSNRDPIAGWLDVFVPMLGLSKARSTEIRAELEDHLRARVDDLMITGLAEPEAAAKAVEELGQTATLARAYRDANRTRRRPIMQTLLIATIGAGLTWGGLALTGSTGQTSPASMPAVEAETGGDDAYRRARYEVGTLVGAEHPLDVTHRGEELVNIVRALVSPAEWAVAGGTWRVMIKGNSLFLEGPGEAHEGVEWVIETLENDAHRMREDEERKRVRQHAEMTAKLASLRKEHEKMIEQMLEIRNRIGMVSEHRNQLLLAADERGDRSDEWRGEYAAAGQEVYRLQLEEKHRERRLEYVGEILLDLEARLLLEEVGGLSGVTAEALRQQRQSRGQSQQQMQSESNRGPAQGGRVTAGGRGARGG